MNPREDRVGALRIAWLLLPTLAVAGIALVVLPLDRERRDELERVQALFTQRRAAAATLQEADRLRVAQVRVQRQIRSLDGMRGEAAQTAETLRLLEAEARRFQLRVSSVVPGPAASPVGMSAVRAPVRLRPHALTIGLRGRFGDIMRCIADLPRHRHPLEIRSVAISPADRASSDGEAPLLNATIAVTLYSISETETKGMHT